MSKRSSIHIKKKVEKLLTNTGDMALKRRAGLIIGELSPQNGDNILDVGCGDGYYLHLLSKLGIKLKLTGTDFDPNALASAKRNLKGKNIKLFQADLMKKLPFENSSFDKVVMSEVTEHLPNDVKGLKEIKRILRPGGVLVLTVPNANYPILWDPVNWILEHLFGTHIKTGFWAGIWNQHIRLYKPEKIKKVVEKAGYKIETVKALTWWCLPFNHNLLHFMARILYGGGFSAEVANSVSKFEGGRQRPVIIDTAFRFVNVFDRVNDLYQTKSGGVGVLVKGIK